MLGLELGLGIKLVSSLT